MSATHVEPTALDRVDPPPSSSLASGDLTALRRNWLARALRCETPALARAESAVAQIYSTCGRRRPRFVWVSSPLAATRLIDADGLAERTTLTNGSTNTIVAAAIRTLLPPLPGVVAWYGQHEAHRLALADWAYASGVVRPTPLDATLYSLQHTLATSTGWWWPFDDVCVMSERPTVVHTEPTPSGTHDQCRLHHDDRPALEFADGTVVYAIHGTLIPEWAFVDPTPERIASERNVEVRRTAIERLGWEHFLLTAGVHLVDQGPDPGNPGHSLRLYSTPAGWRTNAKLLLAVNGSRERDGTRRRYGLQVPGWLHTALDAAAWTYGLEGAQYAHVQRRT
ncbi:DUF6745 domain-containing protein [Gordonia aichiensis]|uniref:DUF6745 domain-containing protein n=1 Tax=Gordonia aichiensis TaxID=36820 RepID=UPI000A07B99D